MTEGDHMSPPMGSWAIILLARHFSSPMASDWDDFDDGLMIDLVRIRVISREPLLVDTKSRIIARTDGLSPRICLFTIRLIDQ